MQSEEIRSVHGTYNGLYIEYSMELSRVLAGDSYTQSTCSLKTRSICNNCKLKKITCFDFIALPLRFDILKAALNMSARVAIVCGFLHYHTLPVSNKMAKQFDFLVSRFRETSPTK